MKTKYALLIFILALSAAAWAQENDDMYFNSRDRLALNESNQSIMAAKYQEHDKQAVKANPVNPSDSYTGRGVNPEFSAQQKNGAMLVQENPDYFLAGYQPKNINSNQYSASSPGYSSCNCGTSSPYGMDYGGFGNPYGNQYSPYGNSYSPYGGYPGLTSSIGYGFGSYGSSLSIGMGYGMGSMYGSPGYGYGSYNPYGYGSSSPYGYGYPSAGVVYGGTDMSQAYGRRPTRASSTNSYVDRSGSVAGTNGRGRVDGPTRTSQSNYYDPSWRSNTDNFPSRNTYNNLGGRSSYSGRNTSSQSWSMDSGRTRSTLDSFGSGSRSSFSVPSGGSSSGSSSGGRSRGRN